ncbi:MAG: hemolysin family protein [Anaerovibrio sp.]|uniref:hemolysin family protein n=1 Tax=Anaerovibrio sp. TaxID=1872532 RepID=UPI0025D8BFE6|nr:hemolysin family protein [Anaerovibrio sp.]MCR5176948.1 hemolysin family protein [Anaerovibrio sp.]
MDTYHPTFILTVIFILILINVFFALAETALTESHKSKLEKMVDDNIEDAKAALELCESPELAYVVIQIGITLISILLGVAASVLLSPVINSYIDFIPYHKHLSLLISIVIITYFTLLISEFLPNSIAKRNPEHTLINCQGLLRKLIGLSRPFTTILGASASFLLSFFGINLKYEDPVTEDEVKDLIEQGTEDGTFEKAEQDLVDRVFHMSDQTAYSIMTPRTQMMWLDLSDSLESNLDLIKHSSEYIIPVGKDSLDDFCGVIYTKDILNAALDDIPLELDQFIRKPMFIPRSMETFRVLEQFKETGIHEAVVLDEYGGVIGFITLQDILIELIGDTNNNNEQEHMHIIPKDDNSWYIDGLCSIDDFKEKFDIDELPDEEQDHYQTMGGFITALFGYIPKKGERIEWDDFIFEILRLDKYRLDRILCIQKVENSPSEEEK